MRHWHENSLIQRFSTSQENASTEKYENFLTTEKLTKRQV